MICVVNNCNNKVTRVNANMCNKCMDARIECAKSEMEDKSLTPETAEVIKIDENGLRSWNTFAHWSKGV